MCWPHRKIWGGPVHSRPKRSSTEQGRVLAWGRLYLVPDAVRRVEEEARRRGGSPSGLLAEIVEGWARQQADADAENGLDCDEHDDLGPSPPSSHRASLD